MPQGRTERGTFTASTEKLTELVAVKVSPATMQELIEKVPQTEQANFIREAIKSALKKIRVKKDEEG